nr:MAG TPA: hypothetical protein [Bacteriophage sp.]
MTKGVGGRVMTTPTYPTTISQITYSLYLITPIAYILYHYIFYYYFPYPHHHHPSIFYPSYTL